MLTARIAFLNQSSDAAPRVAHSHLHCVRVLRKRVSLPGCPGQGARAGVGCIAKPDEDEIRRQTGVWAMSSEPQDQQPAHRQHTYSPSTTHQVPCDRIDSFGQVIFESQTHRQLSDEPSYTVLDNL